MLAIQFFVYIIPYGFSWIMANAGHHYAASVSLILAGITLFLLQYRRTGKLLDFRGLLSVSWICGQGLACLQLSNLQSDWSNMTWLCFGLAYLCFSVVYELPVGWKEGVFRQAKKERIALSDELFCKRTLRAIIMVTCASLAAFLLEAVVLGFIPILSDKPHAYSYFHISGVHYFTVSFVFVPALCLIYYKRSREAGLKISPWMWICGAVSIILPILCVSRFQLIFTVGLAIVVYLYLWDNVKLRYVFVILACLVPIYVILTVFRNHDVTYLNGIFDMKTADTPIYFTQPYIYITNNYENFNCLVTQMEEYTHGLRMGYPVWALSGLKFIFPQLVDLPVYRTKWELSTVTWIYDFYGDFGVVGIIVFTALIGLGCSFLRAKCKGNRNPVAVLFYGQIALYLSFSFFTTWFSNPTTWFYLVITELLYLYVGYRKVAK